MYFYPRSPCGERQINCGLRPAHEHISIHALLAESDPHWAQRNIVTVISIHALLAESDPPGSTPGRTAKISIHALLAESDRQIKQTCRVKIISIHALLAESDSARVNSMLTLIHFYPRSPCGERLSFMLYDTSSLIFLSTLSLRRATLALLFHAA